MSSSPNNSNRPVMRIKLHENEALRSVLAAAKVRMLIRNGRG